jgi:hypothetical protein
MVQGKHAEVGVSEKKPGRQAQTGIPVLFLYERAIPQEEQVPSAVDTNPTGHVEHLGLDAGMAPEGQGTHWTRLSNGTSRENVYKLTYL